MTTPERRIRVKVNAGARSESVRRLDADLYQVRTRAPAERGKANIRVLELLANEFGCPVTQLRIVSGATSPLKTIAITT